MSNQQDINQVNINKLVKFFFTLQLNIKMYHFNTTSYARHKASDQFGDNLLELSDKFIEIFIGRYKVKPNFSGVKINSYYLSDDGSEQLLRDGKDFLEKMNDLLTVNDTELLNIRDELLSAINQTLYLYQLK